jgi:diaminopimelate decarboxylase
MSAPAAAPAKPLRYVDPAEFTPHFAWRAAKQHSGRQVFCEDVSLTEIAARFDTPAYVYSRAAIASAFRDLDRGLGSLPHTLCFSVKSI